MDQTEAVVLISTQFFHWAVVATQAYFRHLGPAVRPSQAPQETEEMPHG